MYRAHFGLRERPFELDDDPAYYFHAPQEAAVMTLSYALEQGQGLAMLTGLPGTGKTTLLRRLIEKLVPQYQGVLLSDTATVGGSLAKQFANALGLKCTRELLPTVLRDHLIQQADAHHMVILMVDEAQNLTAKQFEEVRFLSNLSQSGQLGPAVAKATASQGPSRPSKWTGRTGHPAAATSNRLLQIFLVGQPALEHRLGRPSLEALRQRVAVRVGLMPFGFEQTASYVEFRMGIAGAERPNLFTASAVRRIFEESGGIPRLVNILCERSLLVAYTDGMQWIDRGIVETAIADLNLTLADQEPSPDALLERAEHEVEGVGRDLRKDLARIERKLDRLLAALAERQDPPSSPTAGERRDLSRPRLVRGPSPPTSSPGD